MKNKLILLLFVWGAAFPLTAQPQDVTQLPEYQLEKSMVETQVRFLASDELAGRRTGSPGNNIAARYIAARLQALGYESPKGADNYYQKIQLSVRRPASEGSLGFGGHTFSQGKEMVLLSGAATQLEAPAVFAGYGWVDPASGHDDYRDLDVNGKVVVTLSGLPDEEDATVIVKSMSTKRRLAAERGAAALIEVYVLPYPWAFFRNYFGRERLELDPAESEDETADSMVFAWVQMADREAVEQLKAGKQMNASLRTSGNQHSALAAQNVIGVMPGTDPDLRDEYLLITAHYDHVGTGKQGGAAYTAEDSIFNGARDNAMGTTALLSAAAALAKSPPRRSVIILAVTGEEVGLIGSQYYAENPLIPLEKTIFNLNTDGAGYNNTKGVAIIGWDRTGTNKWIEMGLHPFALEVFADPAPEQNLFDRSDNVSFAQRGVPALSFSPGFTVFDQEMMQYYHQVSDEADTMDFDYVHKFCQAFAHTARLIADSPERPVWKSGDKYEAAGKALYRGGRD